MNKFFIIIDDQLVEVIEHHAVITYANHLGPTVQPHIRRELRYRGKATEENRLRIPRELGGYA